MKSLHLSTTLGQGSTTIILQYKILSMQQISSVEYIIKNWLEEELMLGLAWAFPKSIVGRCWLVTNRNFLYYFYRELLIPPKVAPFVHTDFVFLAMEGGTYFFHLGKLVNY